MGLEKLLKVGALTQQPPHHNVGLVVGRSALVKGVAVGHPDRGIEAAFRSDLYFFVQALEAVQGAVLESLLVVGGGYITEGHEDRVAGVVMRLVERFELFIGEIGNMPWVTAAVVVVGGAGKQVLAQGLPEGGCHGAHGAFHLVEHNTLEHQLAVGVVRLGELYPVSFLGEVQRIQPREEHRIEIHIQQVVEVFAVLAGKRVGGPVRAGERVHEGVKRPAQHHEKGIAHREALAAAQRRVLEYVGDAGRILGHGAQCDEENVFIAVGSEMVVHRTGRFVLVVLHPQVQ